MRDLLAIEDLLRRTSSASSSAPTASPRSDAATSRRCRTLRGRTVVTLFYEASTRTSASFELAAKRLSADIVSVKAGGSSVEKGESLKDTVATLSAYSPRRS